MLTDEDFPHAEIAAAGYRALANGQKAYNGVALLSRVEAIEPLRDLPGLADPQRRVLAATEGAQQVIDAAGVIEDAGVALQQAQLVQHFAA